jgi:hypothetical protein
MRARGIAKRVLDLVVGAALALTGPAQVTKGEDDLDSHYLEVCASFSSWALVRYDLQILWRTVVVIAHAEGLNY